MKFITISLLLFLSPQLLAEESNLEQLNEMLEKQIPADAPGCSVGVFLEGHTHFGKGYGLANLELNVAMDNNNIHRMASVSKQFTAMAVLLLADQGKIDIHDDIRDHVKGLPDYPSKVSINSIINHTAGMGDYDMISVLEAPEGHDTPKGALNLKAVSGHPFRLGNEDYLTAKEFHALVKKLPLAHVPDTKWHYSNIGYVLLAILIEEVSGKTLREFSQEFIFSPLKMHNTFFADDPIEIIKNRAYGYAKNESGEYINNMTNVFWVGDGGLHTTIQDIQKWDRQFYKPVLGEEPRKFMQLFMEPNSKIPVNPGQDNEVLYSNGQFIGEGENGKWADHSGGWLGANIYYSRHPNSHYSNVVMCSNITINSKDISNRIDDWYFQ